MVFRISFVITLLVASVFSIAQQKEAYLSKDADEKTKKRIYLAEIQYEVEKIKEVDAIHNEIKNIILMIGDGMGVGQIFAAMTANNDQLYLQYAKHIGFQKTKSEDKYITDSGAAGTALACGVKTNNGTIGLNREQKAVKSILEIASENEKATGLVAACKITHATPASFIAKVKDRNQYEDIAKFFISDKLDFFVGGGLDDFDNRSDSVSLLPLLEDKDFQIVKSQEELDAIAEGKVAGLLSPGHIPPFKERGDFLLNSTKKALDVLSKDDDGFFLMVEASQIDWAGHSNDLEYILEETLDFDRVVGEVLKFASEDKHTLVIITADHETGGLTVHKGNPEKGEIEGRFSTKDHSSLMVPVFAYGPGAEKFIGIYENTEVFYKMMKAFNFEKTNFVE
jgi:alkaline phosphatase